MNVLVASTRMDPLAAHVAHIRHLSKPSALQSLLSKRHGFPTSTAKGRAYEVAPFLEQALAFHYASSESELRIRPVLQYYSYLNLAVALILVYRPSGWEAYRSHGVEDITRGLNRISLSSRVLRLRRGAAALFHSIISDAVLPTSPITLRQLLAPIAMVSTELKQAFGMRMLDLFVSGEIRLTGPPENQVARSYYTFRLVDRENPEGNPGTARFPLKRLYSAIPCLKSEYEPEHATGHVRTFVSRRQWSAGNRERAEAFHGGVAPRFLNLGGEIFAGGRAQSTWVVARDCQILPTLTAGLLVSFVLASLCRYRANLLARVEDSPINLLCDVFANEADRFMIPSMRNLLYNDVLYLSQVPFT